MLGLNKFDCSINDRWQNWLECPVFDRRPLLACLVFDKQCRIRKFARDPYRSVVFDKAVGGPVGNIRSEIKVKTDRQWAARNGLAEDLPPGSAVLVSRLQVFLAAITCGGKPLFAARGNWPIPAEVPLADTSSPITMLLEHASHGQAIRRDQGRPPQADDSTLQPRTPMVPPG